MAGFATYAGTPQRVRFLARPNRYLAVVRPVRGGGAFTAHVPNPGRMDELLVPDLTNGYVIPALRSGRKTRHDLIAVIHGHTLVSIDARIANRLCRSTLGTAAFPMFEGVAWTPEVRVGPHRFDFGAVGERGRSPAVLLEVKSSNLRVGDTAWFPDAPTERGRRHLEELARWAGRGTRCAVLFAVQRDDVDSFRPNSALDPDFSGALAFASACGVEVRARAMRVEPSRVRWGRWLPVLGVPPPGEPI